MPIPNANMSESKEKDTDGLIESPASAKQLDMLRTKHIAHKWRVQSVGKPDENQMAWVSCVAYIDARQAMDHLNNIVGPKNWQSEFYSVNGKEFCKIGIHCFTVDSYYDWIWKSDTGCESNPKNYKKALEKLKKITPELTSAHIPLLMEIANDIDQDVRVKGQSSDAFKRACVHWGIARNVYEIPMPKIRTKIVSDYVHNPSVAGVIQEKINLRYPDNLNSFLHNQMATRVSGPTDPTKSVFIQ